MSQPGDTALFLHPSAELYGADRTLLQVVEGLDAERWSVVVALPRQGPLAAELEALGATVEVAELGVGARGDLSPRGLARLAVRVPRGFFAVRRLVRAHRPAVVVTNTMVVLGGALAAWSARVPHVWHVHEILERPRWLVAAFARLFHHAADRVVTNSAATATCFVAAHGPLASRTVVVPNGVERVRRRPDAAEIRAVREELDVPADAPLVLLVGRINAWKGQEVLLDAARRLAARHEDVRFRCLGDAPPGQERFARRLDDAIAASGLGERFRALPYRPATPAVHAAADVCVVPSTRPEPFGLVAAEAMACARPVVCSGHGGVAELVVDGATGLHVPPGDADALAQALESLLGDEPLRARLGAAGRARQRAHYTVERYAAEVAELLDEVAGPRPSPETRIVHVVLGKANVARANGVNRVVDQLARAQVRAGRNVAIWGLTPTPAAPAGPRPYTLELFRRGRVRLALDVELRRAIDELEGTDTLLHLHGGLLPELALVARRARRRGVPYVFTPHGTYRRAALAKRRRAKRVCIALFDRGLLRGARAVQALVSAEARELEDVAPRARVVVAPSGQDPLERPDAPPDESLKRPILGYLGRLDAWTKGLDLALDAFASHVAAGRSGTLLLAGRGPDRSALIERARHADLGDRVRFVGPRFGDEKLAFLASLDAFVHPSRHEGLPGAVLEAAALGLPLVVSEGTNLARDVREARAGFAVPDGDPAALAAAFASVERSFRAGQLGERGRRACQDLAPRFGWKELEERIARELYRMDRKAPPPPSVRRTA